MTLLILSALISAAYALAVPVKIHEDVDEGKTVTTVEYFPGTDLAFFGQPVTAPALVPATICIPQIEEEADGSVAQGWWPDAVAELLPEPVQPPVQQLAPVPMPAPMPTYRQPQALQPATISE